MWPPNTRQLAGPTDLQPSASEGALMQGGLPAEAHSLADAASTFQQRLDSRPASGQGSSSNRRTSSPEHTESEPSNAQPLVAREVFVEQQVRKQAQLAGDLLGIVMSPEDNLALTQGQSRTAIAAATYSKHMTGMF